MKFFVYVLWNATHRKTYVGQTADLEKRIREHNDPESFSSKFTKKFSGRWQLIHHEALDTRSQAMRRERELKTGKGRDFIKQITATL